MDLQLERPPSGFLAAANGAQVHGELYQGYCFNAGEWTFPDFPLRGVYCRNEVYSHIRGWNSFGPWLTRIENLSEDVIWNVASEIPPDWYGSQWGEMEKLVRALIDRRSIVRELIVAFATSQRRPFSEWREAA